MPYRKAAKIVEIPPRKSFAQILAEQALNARLAEEEAELKKEKEEEELLQKHLHDISGEQLNRATHILEQCAEAGLYKTKYDIEEAHSLKPSRIGVIPWYINPVVLNELKLLGIKITQSNKKFRKLYKNYSGSVTFDWSKGDKKNSSWWKKTLSFLKFW